MKRIACTLLLACCLLGAACSKPTAEAPPSATATPGAKSEPLEQVPAAQHKKKEVVQAEAVTAEGLVDKPITVDSPSPSASIPKP